MSGQQSAEQVGGIEHPSAGAVRDYLDNAGITPETLRYAATHEALCRSWIFDLLTGLADVLDGDDHAERRCTHCDAEVRPTEHGDWIHAHGLYRCQSTTVAYGHLAHPADVPCRADGPNPCLGARLHEPCLSVQCVRCYPPGTDSAS